MRARFATRDRFPLERCLVLGGSGFIGRHITRHLADRGVKVRAVSRSGVYPFKHDLVEWVAADITDTARLVQLVEGCDACVQAATTTKPSTSNAQPQVDVLTNLLPNVALMEVCERRDVKFLFLSSGGTVYGNPRYVPIDELHPIAPQSSYAIVKVAVENYLSLFRRTRGLKTVILRVSNPFGEHQPPQGGQGVIAAFLWRVLRGEPVEIWGDGRAVRDYIYVSDLCHAVGAALAYQGEESVFNVGSGQGRDLRSIIAAVELVAGRPAQVIFRNDREVDLAVNTLDCTRARVELGWTPHVSFEQGLRYTHDWMVSKVDHV